MTRARARVWLLTVFLAAVGVVVSAGNEPATAAKPPAAHAAQVSGADWSRFDYNAQRSGVGPTGSGINAGNVGKLRLQVVSLDGTVDSSPIELHAVMWCLSTAPAGASATCSTRCVPTGPH